MATLSPVKPNLRPGADHHEMYLSSQRPLYEISDALGGKVDQVEFPAIDAMLVSGKVSLRTCPFCRIVPRTRGAKMHVMKLEKRMLIVEKSNNLPESLRKVLRRSYSFCSTDGHAEADDNLAFSVTEPGYLPVPATEGREESASLVDHGDAV